MYFKKSIITIIFYFLLPFFSFAHEKKADLVVFSYNRPMQLYALLESTEKYITGLEEIHVIYRSDILYKQAYEEIKQTFEYIQFWQQGDNPHQDFKPLTLYATFESPSDYIIFAVDDIIVKDFIDISKSIAVLEKTNAYGFYFRLGLHVTHCYPLNCNQNIPNYRHIQDDIYMWKFKDGRYDWRYPHTVDMTLYRKKDIEPYFRSMRYQEPNTLEGRWAARRVNHTNQIGLFYKVSKIVNLPLNRLQKICKNRTMNAFSPEELLDMFNEGLKIDIAPLFNILNISAHRDYMPTFITREKLTKEN